MTTFAEARAAVLDLTKRTDKVALIDRKINAAVRLLQSTGNYAKDLYEITYSGAGIVGDSDYIKRVTLPSDLRQIAYIQDPGRTGQIKLTTPDWVLDNPVNEDIAYQAGDTLHLRLSVTPVDINLGYYRYLAPLVADDDTNWVLTNMFELVADYATAWVLIVLGEKDMANTIQAFSAQQLPVMVLDRIQQRIGVM